MSRPNYKRKMQEDGILHFVAYEIFYKGETFVLKCHVKRIGKRVREYPYSIKQKEWIKWSNWVASHALEHFHHSFRLQRYCFFRNIKILEPKKRLQNSFPFRSAPSRALLSYIPMFLIRMVSPAPISKKKMKRTINYYKHYRMNDTTLIVQHIKTIYCVIGETNEIIRYDL